MVRISGLKANEWRFMLDDWWDKVSLHHSSSVSPLSRSDITVRVASGNFTVARSCHRRELGDCTFNTVTS
jgi:hypothetical protein